MEEKDLSPENQDLTELDFEQLRKAFKNAAELAGKSFKETGNGFKNANGNGIYIARRWESYQICECSLPEFHNYIVAHPGSVLQTGSPDKETMMQALRKMIEELGNRIIE